MDYQFRKVDKNITTVRRLENACDLGNIDEVKAIIRSNILSKYHINTMHHACKGGSIEIIELIYRACNRTNSGKEMADIWDFGLEGACEGGHINIFNMYKHNLRRERSSTSTYNFMRNCLDSACISGNMECINFIIGMNAHNWREGLSGACQGGHIDVVKFMLHKGASVGDYGWNIGLLEACKRGHIEIVEYMLSKYNRSPSLLVPLTEKILNEMLVSSCAGEHPKNFEIIELIISKGATDLNGGLKRACREGHMHTVEFMITKGAIDWNSGLMASCCGGHFKIVELMVAKGATNLGEGLGYLCYILDNCVEDRVEIAKFILSKNIEDLSLGFYGACRGGCVEIVELILEKYQNGANGDGGSDGSSGGVIDINMGMLRACENECIEVLEFLVRKGATNFLACLETSSMIGSVKSLQFFMKLNTDLLNSDIISRLLLINRFHYYNPDIHVLLLNLCEDSDISAKFVFLHYNPTTNFKLYCWYVNNNKIALSSKQYNEILKAYPPYVLFIGSRSKDRKCHISRLPVELFRLLFGY